jgi:mannose-6-phosphate isomerase
MHLFEALLALYEVTGTPAYLERASVIFDQFTTRLFQPETGTIPEYFDSDWSPVGGAQAVWEPGHHMEWSWLLSEYETLSGVGTSPLADRLLETAYRHGVFPPALIVDEVRGDGTVMKKSCRAWPLTEAAKAQAVRVELGDMVAAEPLADALDCLQDRHLSGIAPGLWSDHFSADGKLIPDYVPASTLYHIAMSVFVTDGALGHARDQV